jgi:hypothetical protein
MNSKQELVREYLKQQMAQSKPNQKFVDDILEKDNIQIHHNQLQLYKKDDDDTQDADVEDFKNQVRNWLRLDSEIKEINNKIKLLNNERKQRKKFIDVLSVKIMQFMSENDIDELNSRDGVLKYKKSYIKKQVTQKEIKENIKSVMKENTKLDEILKYIFQSDSKVEKCKLLRS